MAVERFTGAQTNAAPSEADLTGKEYYAAKMTSTGGYVLAGDGDYVDGVISEGKAIGLHTSVKTGNQVKAIAGAAVAIGARVTPNSSGKFITATTGKEVFGRAISAAAAADALFTIEVDRSQLDLPA